MVKQEYEICCGTVESMREIIWKACEVYCIDIGQLVQTEDGETCDGVSHSWPTVSTVCEYEDSVKLKDAMQFAAEISSLLDR